MKEFEIDPTIGYTNLSSILQEQYKILNEEKAYTISKLHRFVIKLYDSNHWFINMLGQYPECLKVPTHDILAFSLLDKSFAKGEIYVSVFKLNNWAFRDYDYENNINNLIESIGEGVTCTKNNKGSSDGYIGFEEIVSLPFDEFGESNDIPLKMNNVGATLEFGTTDLGKTCFNLWMGNKIFRVPYLIDGIDYPIGCLIFKDPDAVKRDLNEAYCKRA